MNESTHPSSNTGWLIGLLIVLIVMVALLIGFLSREPATSGGAELKMTPMAGGVTMPTATPINLPSTNPGLPSGATDTVLAPGRQAAVVSTDGRGTRVYAAADSGSLVMDVYRDGALFVVLEPGGDVTSYPVTAFDKSWYRVRAGDGLVGWVLADQLVPLD